ncbi:hypothetical protein TrVE_jg8889 [Triparma verrucosa]|uniref:Uncharacterized protein n=1 Tax=Triparma verrucosa TaxID=1606542 RepID=A0A9W7DLH5_9STRA|nr:hypothetical protein TrVE_jg8889 [Triparma verrucosa]
MTTSVSAACLSAELSPFSWSSDSVSELADVINSIECENEDKHTSSAMLLAPESLTEKQELAAILLGTDEDTSVPGIYAASSGTSGSILSTPSTALEAAGAAPMTFKNLVYVIEKTGDATKHPPKSVVISALENIAKFTRRTGSSATLTVVVIGDVDAEEVKDDALFGIENLLGDSAFGTSDSCRLSDVFDLSMTKVVKYKDLTPPAPEPASEYLSRVKKSISTSRAFTRHVSSGVKLTSQPSPEEEDEDFDNEAMGIAIAETAKLQQTTDTVTSAFEAKIIVIADSDTVAVRDFGAQTAELMKEGVENFDSAADVAKNKGVNQGDIAKMRKNMIEEMRRAFTVGYKVQLENLEKEEFGLFKKNLSALRVTPQLASEMDDALKTSVKAFGAAVATLGSAGSISVAGSSPLAMGANRSYKEKVKAFNEERLLAARASGSFQPIPRKPISLSAHYLIPSLFNEGDYRQTSQQDPNNIIYTPNNKRSEVLKEDVLKGRDWRSKVSPPSSDPSLVFNP